MSIFKYDNQALVLINSFPTLTYKKTVILLLENLKLLYNYILNKILFIM